MPGTTSTTVDHNPQHTDPLAPLKGFGVRVCWVPDLGTPAAYVAEYRVMLLDAQLSRAEVFAYVRRWIEGRLSQ